MRPFAYGVWLIQAMRSQAILSLLDLRPTLVRGNASEIMALAGAAGTGKGVDSTAQSEEAIGKGKTLATQYHTIVAITGATDLVRTSLACGREDLAEYGGTK